MAETVSVLCFLFGLHVRFDTSHYFNCNGYIFVVFIFGNGNSPSYYLPPKVVGAINGCPNTIIFL